MYKVLIFMEIDFVLILFIGKDLSNYLNLRDIFVWEIKLTTSLGAPFY